MSVIILKDYGNKSTHPNCYTPVNNGDSFEESLRFARGMINRALRNPASPDFTLRVTSPALFNRFEYLEGTKGVIVKEA